MKNLVFVFILFSAHAYAGGPGGTPYNIELFYLYGGFIGLMLLIVGTDWLIKYVIRKVKEYHQKKIMAGHTDSLNDL